MNLFNQENLNNFVQTTANSQPSEQTPVSQPLQQQPQSQARSPFPKWLIMLIVLILISVGGGGYYLYSMSQKKTENTVQIKPVNTPAVSPTRQNTLGSKKLDFNNGQIVFSFSSEIDIPPKKISENVYELEIGLIRSYSITYYKSKQELLPKVNFSKDSDGENAGQGCYFDETSKVSINNYDFKQVICYHNPINLTKSGKHIPSISSISKKECVYDFGNDGILLFRGTVPVDSDVCDLLFKGDLSSFAITVVSSALNLPRELKQIPLFPGAVFYGEEKVPSCEEAPARAECGKTQYKWRAKADYLTVVKWYTEGKSNSGWEFEPMNQIDMEHNPIYGYIKKGEVIYQMEILKNTDNIQISIYN